MKKKAYAETSTEEKYDKSRNPAFSPSRWTPAEEAPHPSPQPLALLTSQCCRRSAPRTSRGHLDEVRQKVLCTKKRKRRTTLLNDSGVDTASLRSGVNVPLRNASSLSLSLTGGSFGLGLLLLLLLDLFRVTIEEHVHHDVPAIRSAGDGTPQPEDLTSQQPPDKTDRVASLVVRGYGDVDELERCVGIAKGNDWDVDVGRFTDGLVVHARVGNDDESRLLERAGDVVCEATRGEATSDGLCTCVSSELENGTVAVWACGDDANVVRIFDGSDDTGSKDELFPGLADVDKVDTWIQTVGEPANTTSPTSPTNRQTSASRRRVPSAYRSSLCLCDIGRRGASEFHPQLR